MWWDPANVIFEVEQRVELNDEDILALDETGRADGSLVRYTAVAKLGRRASPKRISAESCCIHADGS